MEPVYPNLRAEIAKRGIKIKAIAACLRISEKALSNKINGKTDFTWPEACKISNCFFRTWIRIACFLRITTIPHNQPHHT